jgi:two-component system, cell cycle response regulator
MSCQNRVNLGVEAQRLSEPKEPELYQADEVDESTAIVSLAELRSSPRKQSKDRHLLVRVKGAELGRVSRLPPEQFRVGRSQDCELWLGDDGVSRKHARIFQDSGLYVIEDTESANGTFVQGQRVTRQALRDGDVIQFGPTAVFRYTITDESQEALLQQLYEASVTDALTGAHNREHFDTQLRSELSYARRHKADISLAFFDVDHFKKVNDTYGHQGGDAVLVALANTIRAMIRNEDVFARYGGEEFALILRGIDLSGASTVGERLRERVEAMRVPFEDRLLRVTCSVGCAAFAELEDKTPEGLVGAADKRLYAAKRSGRNRVVSEG